MRRAASNSRLLRSAPALGLLLAACCLPWLAACHRTPAAAPSAAERIVWPAPPAAPRIEYLRQIRTPRDLGLDGSAMTRFFRWMLRGRRQHGLARPFAVACREGLLAVADPDGRSVHLFDRERRRYRRLIRTGRGALVSPVGVAFGSAGRLYVSDSALGRIAAFDVRHGRFIGYLDPDPAPARPTGLAFDKERGLLFVVDTLGHRLLALDEDGKVESSFGSRGLEPGQFNYPVAVTLGPEGNLFVADAMNFRVQRLDAGGAPLGSFGRPGRGGGAFEKIKGLAVDGDGQVYAVDAMQDTIQVFSSEGELLGRFSRGGSGPGELWLPAGICIDEQDTIFVADSANHRLQVFRYLSAAGGGA